MKITMRLYRQHDLDLVYLYKSPGFSLQKNIKAVLRAHADAVKTSSIKGCPVAIPQTKPFDNYPKQCQFHILLSPENDADLIAWIETVPRGYRNSMIKNVFRTYLPRPVTAPYDNEFQIKFTEEKKKIKDEDVSTDDILSTPLPTSSGPIKMSESQNILENTEKIKEKKKEKIASNKPETNDSEEFDLFNEFKSMMDGC